MAKVFDQDHDQQDQPKSPLAQSLNAAFAGCDKWTVAPPRRRTLTLSPALQEPPPLHQPPR